MCACTPTSHTDTHTHTHTHAHVHTHYPQCQGGFNSQAVPTPLKCMATFQWAELMATSTQSWWTQNGCCSVSWLGEVYLLLEAYFTLSVDGELMFYIQSCYSISMNHGNNHNHCKCNPCCECGRVRPAHIAQHCALTTMTHNAQPLTTNSCRVWTRKGAKLGLGKWGPDWVCFGSQTSVVLLGNLRLNPDKTQELVCFLMCKTKNTSNAFLINLFLEYFIFKFRGLWQDWIHELNIYVYKLEHRIFNFEKWQDWVL